MGSNKNYEEIVIRLLGRAKFIRDSGGVKSAELLEEAAKTIKEFTSQQAAEAELARWDAAAGEPVYQVGTDGHWYDCKEYIYREAKERRDACRILYTAAQPSALPPEIVRNINGLGFYQGRLIFGGAVGWYNQAIADAKALGCKAIKLPEKLKWDYNDGVTKDEVYSFNNAIDACAVSLRKAGFTVEGE